jgi:hypothetical protein
MPPPVRVIGPSALATHVAEALRAAGEEATVYPGTPTAAFAAPPPADGGADVVIAAAPHELSLWRKAKRRSPARPMLAVGEKVRERALRGAVDRRHGVDAHLIWPATPAELAEGLERARAAAGRSRRWTRADLADALCAGGLLALLLLRPPAIAAGLLVVLVGLGLLDGVRAAWNPRGHALLAAAVLLLGAGIAAFDLLRRLGVV